MLFSFPPPGAFPPQLRKSQLPGKWGQMRSGHIPFAGSFCSPKLPSRGDLTSHPSRAACLLPEKLWDCKLPLWSFSYLAVQHFLTLLWGSMELPFSISKPEHPSCRSACCCCPVSPGWSTRKNKIALSYPNLQMTLHLNFWGGGKKRPKPERKRVSVVIFCNWPTEQEWLVGKRSASVWRLLRAEAHLSGMTSKS